MLVTPSRIAYSGLFGKPGIRTFGAWIFYVALERPFRIAVGATAPSSEQITLVPPYVPHLVSTTDRELGKILIEAETLAEPATLERLVDTPARAAETRAHILNAFARPLPVPEDFDDHFLGHRIAARDIDTRIARAFVQIGERLTDSVTAKECAAEAGLSLTRFTHLFSSETGTTFRRFRAWKRARSLMSRVTHSPSLVEVALDTGYSDSAHFSHAIRQFYGITPRDIISGSRRLMVVSDPVRG